MQKEKRKNSRKPMRYTAWVAMENSQLHGCVVADISETGARLDVENSEQLPDNFTLLLSGQRNNTPHRHCHVVWRLPNQIGVHFEKRIAEPVKPTAVAKPDDRDTPAAEPASAESA